MFAGGWRRRDGRAAERAVFEDDVDFDGRIAARIKNLPALNEFELPEPWCFAFISRDSQVKTQKRRGSLWRMACQSQFVVHAD